MFQKISSLIDKTEVQSRGGVQWVCEQTDIDGFKNILLGSVLRRIYWENINAYNL